MEFEQYLEKDILTFLDSKIARKENTSIDREEEYGLYLTKDYLKELNYALDNDELTRAKKLFDELKANYARLPKNSIERKKIYSLLERMYEKIQNYVRIKEGRIEIIKQGDSEIHKDRTDKFEDIREKLEREKTPVVDVTPEFDFSRKTALPFKTSAEIKKELLKEGLPPSDEIEKKKTEDTKTPTIPNVEPNITSSTIKDVNVGPGKISGKYYEDKTIKEEEKDTIETQNTFQKNKHEESKPKENIQTEHKTPLVLEKKEIQKKSETIPYTPATEHHHIYRKHEYEEGYDVPDTIIVKHHGGQDHNKKEMKLRELKEEIIDKTSTQLEKLKTQITEILLNELNKKIEEKRNEENQKIENIRKEITRRMIDELNQKLQEERGNTSNDVFNQTKKLREEILSQIYHEAQHLVASKDNPEEINNFNNPKELYVNIENIKNTENATEDSENSTDADKWKYNNNNNNLESYASESSEENRESPSFSGQELRVVYEQAIYYMFDNKYKDAAKLFQRIINANPSNKAARIRLQECIEKQPEIANISEGSEEYNDSDNSNIKNINDNFSPDDLFPPEQESENIEDINKGFDEFKNSMSENVEELTTNIQSLTQSDSNNKPNTLKHRYNDAELQRMYEEAIYTMFQNNYDEAAKLFKQILKIKPENKAARIRLHECLEATHNA